MLRPTVLIWVALWLLGRTASAENLATPLVPDIPLPVNIPSNLFSGDVTPDFVQQMAVIDMVPESLVQIGDPSHFAEYVFVVDKKVRSLGIWRYQNQQWKRVAYHPTDIGKKTGDKSILGDYRTPEGIYFFIDRYEGKSLDYSKYGSRAFATDYPNLFDRREGKTGSGIWLHAVPDSVPLTRGSRGCVVVRDEIIKKVTDYISLRRTPVIIKSEEKYLPVEQWQARRDGFKTWLEDWRRSWQSLNNEAYMSYYSREQFHSMNKDWQGWKRYKEALNKKYDYIRLEFSEPLILTHRNEAVIQFLQDYRSDTFSDFGEKTLYLKKEDDGWKIVSEQWKKVPLSKIPIHHKAAASSTQVGAVEPKLKDN